MSKSSIPQKVQSALWARAGGRCQYRGCNSDLIGDLISGRQDGVYGFIAHIVADVDTGPRGDPIRSPLLCRSIENLMIMCSRHHKLIDVDAVAEHSEAILLSMKAQHESRISCVTSIDEDRASHVVRYAANIGDNEALVSTRDIFSAMLPDHYPENGQAIDIEITGSSFKDNEASYWNIQRENLRRQFESKIRGRIERQEIRHLSVFALAPQPLLIELGRLLCDIAPTNIYQRHREPATWQWQNDRPRLDLKISEPRTKNSSAVALKLSVSATITDDRIHSVLGPDAEIWSIGADDPNNDIVRSPEDLKVFRKKLRKLYNKIKSAHGMGTKLHIFPALPASLAIEVGRVWMPKSDLPLALYDNYKLSGFILAFEVS